MTSQIEKEFEDNDKNNSWPLVYQKIRNEASLKSISAEHSVGEARKPENRSKNRYRDVSPYDHSRVTLQRGECDYINASLVQVPESNRRYILSQGPLEHTASQFWQMIWEQGTKAVIMLNRVIEKGTLKCHQYWPLGEDDEDEMIFDDTGLKVTLLEEQAYEHYIVRTLDLEDLQTGDSREVLHFHYVTWPDFGVPSSPVAFLGFLEEVREHGVLEKDVGPAVIHCSAGIGRSGTFCLVDSALILVEKTGSLQSLDVLSLLLSMRSFRMGLIQTPEQLRFSYLAILEGSKKYVSNVATPVGVNDVLEEYLDMSGGGDKDEQPPTPPQRTSSLSPTKPRHGPPPPPPPRRAGPGETSEGEKAETGEEPPQKRTKTDDGPSPSAPAKPPRSSSGHVAGSSKHEDGASNDNSIQQHQHSVVENNSIVDSENNNPGGKGPPGGREKQSAPGEGQEEEPRQLVTRTESQSVADAAMGTIEHSESMLRQRRREERKKKTKEMIASMKEKQRQSETWKKRKTYYKPVAIGLTLILGGLLLYKMLW